MSGSDKSKPRPGESERKPMEQGRPTPTPQTSAEQTREAGESRKARDAQETNRERMVDIGRGNQQAGRQK